MKSITTLHGKHYVDPLQLDTNIALIVNINLREVLANLYLDFGAFLWFQNVFMIQTHADKKNERIQGSIEKYRKYRN